MRWQLFGYLAGFVVVLLILLWVFQVVLLEDFYKRIKINEVKSVGSKIEEDINSKYIGEVIDSIAERKALCIVLTNMQGNVVYRSDQLGSSSIYYMSTLQYYLMGVNAEENGGSLLYYFNYRDLAKNLNTDKQIWQKVPVSLKNQDDSVIYTKIVTNNKGNDLLLLINSVIAPVDATVSTIRKQLIYVSIIMLILAFLLALYIARRIASPIITMNNKAKALATGDESILFEEKGYKEIAELSATLSYASKELTQVEKLRREFIANVSHDLRTPLTLITGYAELMRDLPTENTPENVQVIVEESKRLTRLVNDLLDLSKLQAGTGEMHYKVYNLTMQIQELLARYHTLTNNDGYTFIFEPVEEIWIEADELKISQVLYNLINNAINYTGEDRIVRINQVIIDKKVRIEIIDSGEGIDQSYLPYIWERYYKVDKTHKRASIGTGLGLSIVRTILDAHHATYGVKSDIGIGSTFWFEMETYNK